MTAASLDDFLLFLSFAVGEGVRESPGVRDITEGAPVDMTGMFVDETGMTVDETGMPVDETGITVDGTAVDTGTAVGSATKESE